MSKARIIAENGEGTMHDLRSLPPKVNFPGTRGRKTVDLLASGLGLQSETCSYEDIYTYIYILHEHAHGDAHGALNLGELVSHLVWGSNFTGVVPSSSICQALAARHLGR